MFGIMIGSKSEKAATPAESRIDVGALVADREKDRAVVKAKAQGEAVVKAVEDYNERVAQVACGKALWANGSADIRNECPREFIDRKRAADVSVVRAWRRWFGKNKLSFDTALEKDRRDVETTWQAFVDAMTKLESDERAIRAVHPHGIDYPDRTAISELAKNGTLIGWVSRTWTPKHYQRPPLPRVDIHPVVEPEFAS